MLKINRFISKRIENINKLTLVLIFFGFTFNFISWAVLLLVPLSLNIQWIVFTLWSVSIFLFVLAFIENPSLLLINKYQVLKFTLVTLLAVATRFLLLDDFPFVTIGDMVRDGAWDAARLSRGEIENIFGYSRYQSHGYLINKLLLPFYSIYGNTDMSFKVATAVFSIVDIWVVFFIGERFIRNHTGFIAALIMIGSQIHLFYARTEIVVMSASLIVSILILSIFYLYEKYSYKKFLLVALLVGISFNFYSSTKPIAFIILLIGILLTFKNYLSSRSLKKLVIVMISACLFVLIGFGPRLIYTTPEIFFNTKRIAISQDNLSEQNTISLTERAQEISENYKKSLMIYFYEDSKSHYSNGTPLVPFVFGLFFLYGICEWLKKPRERLLLLPLIFLIPLSNSAITDIVNADHRTAGLIGITSLATGVGIMGVLSIKMKKAIYDLLYQETIALLVTITLLWNVFVFFHYEYAGQTVPDTEMTTAFMMTYTTELLSDKVNTKKVCVNLSKDSYEIFDLMHYKEQFEYTNPDKDIELKSLDDIASNEVYLSENCENEFDKYNYTQYKFCDKYQKYKCPTDQSSFLIFLHNNLVN